MKTYKSNLPQITLKLTKGETLNAKIGSSKDAASIFRQIWDVDSLEIYESVICIFLNKSNNTIGWFKVSQGGLSASIIDVRIILATALNCLAAGMIICHNHPSGNVLPSESDERITKKLHEAGKLMDIQLLDHLIISEKEYYSFTDNAKL